MRVDQLGLLLWKNYGVRKRQPGIMALVFGWPVFVFMILYTVRDNVELENFPTCQFPARSMPQDGLLPFVQSFICSVGNPCEPFSEYEEVPSYKNATLGRLVVDLQPMLNNATILSAIESLPKSIQLLKSMAQILTQPEIKSLFDKGIRLGDLFNNHVEIKSYLKQQMPNVTEGFIDGLFSSSIKLLYLIEMFGSSNVDGVICSPESLKKYLIVPNERDFAEISKVLCEIDSKKIPHILESLSKHLDFSGLLGMVDRVMAKFRDYDFFQDLKRTVETILDLKTIEKYVPQYLRLREWLPKMIMVFQNVTFKEIDLTFINKSIAVLDPIFSSERDWTTARRGFLRLNKLLGVVKSTVREKNPDSSNDLFAVVDQLLGILQFFSAGSNGHENVTQIIDLTFSILQDGAKLTNKILDIHSNDIQLSPEILNGLKDFFSDNVINSFSYMVSFLNSIIEMTHHVAIIHESGLQKIHDVAENHVELVQQLLRELNPKVYPAIVRSFSRLDFVEKFVSRYSHTTPEELFCEKDTLNEIFDDFKDPQLEFAKINSLLCSESGKRLIADVYTGLEFDRFQKIVTNTLSTVASMVFSRPIPVEKSNLTSLVRSIKDFVLYLESPSLVNPDWSIFQVSQEWIKVFEETETQGRLDILGIHLSIAKMLGSRSLSYITIKPSLENMDKLAGMILNDLHDNDKNWVPEVRQEKWQLIESFYLTVADREKVLKILEFSNFSRNYCVEPGAPALLNFPKGSNETHLKKLVCRLSKFVERYFDQNVTQLELEVANYDTKKSFNWTEFNVKVIEIYGYIDSVVHYKDEDYDVFRMEELQDDFRISWTRNISIKDACQISVGLICKLFSIMEKPVFQIQTKSEWRHMYAIAWASSVVFDNFERIVDQIQKNDNVAKLPVILEDMQQTEILISALLRNLAPVILDILDIITMKPIHLISVIDDYNTREKQWPCVLNESLGSAIELREGSREIVREIERISCNPAMFIKEWREQPILVRVRKIFQHDDTVQLPPFNWTLGYVKFRRLITKFDNLLNDAKEVVLAEDPKLKDYLEALSPQVESIFDERLPGVIDDARNILEYVDLEMDKVIKTFGSDLSGSRIWTPEVSIEDRVLVLSKFLSHLVHKASHVAAESLRDGSEISLLSLLGFDRKSPVSIFYNDLPYILSTLINGLMDPAMDARIIKSLSNKSVIECSEVFEWFSGSVIGLTYEQYARLKNFTCDLDPENFNSYTDLYMAESVVWRKPVNSYRSYLMTAIGDVYNLAKIIKKTMDKKKPIEAPFSRKYVENVLRSLKYSLETHRYELSFHKDSSANYEWTNYRLLLEGFSEVFDHMGKVLKNVDVKSGEIHLWDLVEHGDARQLLKILEIHPQEAIALVASLSAVNSTSGHLVPYEELRKTMCSHQFYSNFWTAPNRTHFLKQICSFDPYQLLKTVTSEEYFDALIGRTSALLSPTPLSSSLTMLLDVVLNLTSSDPNLKLRSNIFNTTTWKNLSNETRTLIRKSEEIWVHEYAIFARNSNNTFNYLDDAIGSSDLFTKMARFIQLLDSLAELLSGGDVWQKLRVIYESSKIKPILTLIEDIPNLAVTAIDTFVTSERLNDFMEKLFLGKLHPCDIDKYLIPPTFMRRKGLLSSITSFCQKILASEKQLAFVDVLPLDLKHELYLEILISQETWITKSSDVSNGSFNETYLLEKIEHFQSTLIRMLSEGVKDLKVPIWWTSFEEGALKDFLAQYKKKDSRELAHLLVKKSSTILSNLANSIEGSQNCTWCTTLPIEILNSQLANHELYSKLVCQLNHLNVSGIYDVLRREFYWNKTMSMIKDYSYLNRKKTVSEVVSAVETTLHYVADIIVNFHNDTYSEKVGKCFYKFVGGHSYSRPGLYISLLLGILDSLQKHVAIFDTATSHRKITELTKLAEKFVPIWKPLRDVTKKADAEEIDAFLPNAMININAVLNDRKNALCRSKIECQNSTALYNYLNSKRAAKVFRYDPEAAKYPSVYEISERLARSLDLDLIGRELFLWRIDAGFDLTWLREILKHLEMVIGESSTLLDVASKIDFEDISNVLGVPDVADGVITILKEKTVDKLFAGVREVLEDVEPLMADKEVMGDLNSMVTALESMEIFKNLGLLDLKYSIKEMFDNWDEVRIYLVDKVGISNDVALTLSRSKIDMLSVFMKERRAISLKDTICSPKKLRDMLSFDNTQITAEEVSSTLCQLEDAQTQNITITLIKNVNFDYIFKNLMSANVKNILANANLTETEGKIVLDNLGVASELLPFFRDRLTSSLPPAEAQEDNTQETEETISASKFLQDSSEMLCGKQLVSDNSQLYKLISRIEDNTKEFDQRELDSLPTDFCRETYKSLVTMGGGKIVWSYVKPLLRGHILYAPNTIIASNIMSLANQTFIEMESFGKLTDSFEKTLTSLANLSDMSDNLRDLQDIMSSDVMKIAIKSFGGGNFEGDFSDLNLGEISWRLKKSKSLITMVGMLNDLMDCVLVDRIRGFPSEDELEEEASRLMETREFLAGVIFLHDERSKRSLDEELPENMTYKIRMDIDYVQSTKRLKNQFWIPGPESSFIEHLRYLRGFIQLQDSIDRAIVKLKTQRDQNWKTVTQQMPYPCWQHAPFQSTLYESQGVQVCFFFALMMCVGSAVRHIVWERESRNSMVMSVMGLKPWRNTMAWYITSFVEVMIVMLSISIILLPGKILPRSDPSLILLLMLDYSFSVVTYCYMISTMFTSASLAAVTTVVMFLLTYMPYVIVIAMEAHFGLFYKLLICLSMSTSFCYGCLYAVRKEVQGVGLKWEAMWQESSPGDPMSLGLVFITIAIDGCIYALIGYVVTRFSNSGKGFDGLRSRSLWWVNKRCIYGKLSYLAFVNNLYFTNDVLHPSDTYQEDESDASSLNVTEKQTGVKFEGIRKVYNTPQGDVVAVDDFTLKLCEGEVTSLLGRNGAGKTTIIKMLTGMLAPSSGEICLNGEESCKPDIGVCPQDNVLIGTLTPREHMIFYAKLKRSKNNIDMQRSVNEMLKSLELGRQEHEPVSRLSGGTKRRLCVALAFLGSPKLVILDEPGAGVDPAARRRIWRLIDQHRIGRTVILSTHHLDEADMLSDTVVVMHKGKILCTGSPVSLKMTYGRGYRLHVSFPSEREPNTDSIERKKLETLRTVIEEIVPNATINEISGSEVIVTLPFQGKHGINNDISLAAKTLEDNQKLLGYSHFSLDCDSLEKVFLDLCARADSGSSSIRASQDTVASVDHISLPISHDDVDLLTAESTLDPGPIRQAKALLKKRIWHFSKDWLAIVAGLVLPTIFVAVAMGFSLIRPPSEDEPPLVLTPKLYDVRSTYFYSIDSSNDPFLQHVSLQLHDRFGDDYAGAWQATPNDTGTCECLEGQQVCHDVSQAVEGLLQILPGRPTLDWIVSTHQEYIEKRYGGWSLSHFKEDPLFVVWYNNKGHHSLPSYLNALNDAILRASGIQGHITTLNHPLKLSSDQLNRTTLLQHVADVGIALVLLIAFSLVGAQGSKELVRERLSEEKRILYLAGVHPLTYWTTALIWDFIVFLGSIGLAVIVFEIFGLPAYIARDNLPGVCLLLLLFAWGSIPFSHIMEKIFDDPSLSNMVLFCLNTFIGVASLATILVLDILGKTKEAEETRNILHNILLIFPQYALGDGLMQISRNDITARLLEKFNMNTYKSPLGWDLLGPHYTLLIIVGAVLYTLNLLLECRLLPRFERQKYAYEVVQEDDDVARERMRVEGGMSDDILQTVKLRKEYRSVYGTNVAVQNLSIGIQNGSCFGLLGTNGAGKSTTFRMLTTEIVPTAGRIILKGNEIGSSPLCNGEIGYCPQTDALDGFLSPHQCLTIHGEVCGLSNVSKAVETMLKRLDLLKYAHRRVDSLSGGNKRKLCAAISVMSPVSVVLMDEPTSGMDPATKDLVSKAIKRVVKNRGCVILTSHSVADCENICNKVAILARAGLKCIGTPQHLKHKFGEGYVAFLRFSQPVSAANLKTAIHKYLPQAVISSRQGTAARLLVPRTQDVPLSISFSKVKLLADELKATDYTLTQSSLDQVLVNFSEELEDDSIEISSCKEGSRNSLASMYSSMDTIHMETF